MPYYNHVAVILEGSEPNSPFRHLLAKHNAFEAALDDGNVIIRFYDRIAETYRAMPMPRESVRLIKRGEQPNNRKPDVDDLVQVVGRKRGGIVTRWHFTQGVTVLFANKSQSEIRVEDLTYDDVRGIWYYSEQ